MANPAPRHLESALGLESGVVRLVPYNPAWLGLFIVERSRIEAAVGRAGIDLKLEHTGSTSVPGVCAKPILDILAGASDTKTLQRAIAALQNAEYQYRGEQGIPGRHFFRRGEPRQYHVHLTMTGSAFWRDHLAFRDYLRGHRDTASAYGALKQALAEQYPRDRESYIEGKTGFVEEVLRIAARQSR
jgi:GrpB-like predicted nucleotidyltransferase (UPF0157 family)